MTFRHYATVHLLAGALDPGKITLRDVTHAVEVAGWIAKEIEAAAKRENPEKEATDDVS